MQLGYQLYLSGNLKDSLVEYRRALQADDSSLSALAGIMLCQIMEGDVTEAEQQLEFLTEVCCNILPGNSGCAASCCQEYGMF